MQFSSAREIQNMSTTFGFSECYRIYIQDELQRFATWTFKLGNVRKFGSGVDYSNEMAVNVA